MLTTAKTDLLNELQDLEFRKFYGAAVAKSELAIAIASARHDLRLTQEEMSKKLGVSQPYTAKLEGGEANPTIGAIGSILAILNLRVGMSIVPLISLDSLDESIVAFAKVEYKPANTSGEDEFTTENTETPTRIIREGTSFSTDRNDTFNALHRADEISAMAIAC